MTYKKSFEIDRKAQQYFEGPDALPPTWLRRKEDPDFFVDYVVEIDLNAAPSGMKFGIQPKGTASPDRSGDFLKFRLRAKHLAYYVERAAEAQDARRSPLRSVPWTPYERRASR